jgi:hypothetical protein
MGIHRGPNIVKDDLVFGYDTGYGVADNSTATRFYAGKSVDNEFYNSGANGNILDHSSGYGGYGTVQTGVLDASGTTQNAVYRKTGKIRFGPTGGQDIGTLTNGNTYTFSIYLRHVAGQTESTSMEFDIVDQSSGGYNYTGTLGSNMTYEWKRFSVTNTHTNSSNYHFIDLGTYQGTNVFEWCMPQIESGTVASPFTSTERSSTQSLIDLKRTADIDLSNVSFDSIGQPEFDGAGDYIDLPDSLITNLHGGTEASICIWIKNDTTVNGVGTSGIVQLSNYNSSNGCLWFYNNGYTYLDIFRTSRVEQVFANNTEVSTNWNLLTVTTTPGANGWKCYMNGVLKKQVSGQSSVSVADIQGGLTIGRNNSSRYTNGKIAACQIYNRALTAAEVIQNYNAQKNRFNI